MKGLFQHKYRRFIVAIGVMIIVLIGAYKLHARPIIADLSDQKIHISWDFSGTDVLLFGAFESHESSGTNTDVVVVATGPLKPLLIRKKERVKGIWLNNEQAKVTRTPSYYFLASNRSLGDIASPSIFHKLGIGRKAILDKIAHKAGKAFHPSQDAPSTKKGLEYAQALVRLMERDKLYQFERKPVNIQEGRLFRVSVDLPDNVPVGQFICQVYMFRSGKLIGQYQRSLNVAKFGVEAIVYNMAYKRPFLYGVLAVLFAALAGYLASAIFGRIDH